MIRVTGYGRDADENIRAHNLDGADLIGGRAEGKNQMEHVVSAKTAVWCAVRRRENILRIVVAARGVLLSCPSVNILIENCDTLEYLTEAGKWTKNPCDGRRFPATAAALQIAKREPIGKFNIVCHIPGTNQFINLDRGRGKGVPDASVPPTLSGPGPAQEPGGTPSP